MRSLTQGAKALETRFSLWQLLLAITGIAGILSIFAFSGRENATLVIGVIFWTISLWFIIKVLGNR